MWVRFSLNKRVLYTLLSALAIIGGSVIAIRYAQGYYRRGIVEGTGLLVANSFPSGAEVYVDSKLTTATDDTLYLEPGKYEVQIRKDGYSPWQKSLQIESELVTQTNAQLFRVVPSLTPLTFTGVKNVSPSPDGQKLLFYTSSASAQTRNGLYLLDLSSGLLSSQREARQVSDDGISAGFDLNTATFIWSPNNTEVIVSSNNREVLLDLSKKNTLGTLSDISLAKRQMLREWESELYLRERQFMSRFPSEILAIATQSAKNVYLSPDKKKILYTATAAVTIPENITPSLPASSSQPESRTLTPGGIYVYDREEDKNFQLTITPEATPAGTVTNRIFLATDLADRESQRLSASPSAFQRLQATASAQTAANFASHYSSLYSTGVQWFPDSRHVFFGDKERIYISEYDNTNHTPVYVGPFAENFVYPWPDGSKLLILTSFSANLPDNLYAIELK